MQDKTNLKHFLCPKTYILIEIIAQKTALFRLVSYCFEEECSPSESLRFTCESWQAGRHQFHYIFEFRVPGTDLLLPLKATTRLDSRCLSTRGGSALIGFRPEADPPWAKTAFQNIILGTDLLLPLKATTRLDSARLVGAEMLNGCACPAPIFNTLFLAPTYSCH